MILRRQGNKKKMASKILPYFPPHKLYIEPFFGAGGLFFSKPKAKYNIVNDLDSDVFNLFQVVSNQKKELEQAWVQMPIHIDLWNYWKKNKETDPIKRAIRFLFLSNYGYMGNYETIRTNSKNTAKLILENIEKTNEFLFGVEFMNCSFDEMLSKVSLKKADKNKVFIYCDPPYLGTNNNYENGLGFTEELSFKLFEILEKTGEKYAVSEFDHPFILNQAKERGLNVINLGERKNLTNRRAEILITNYQTSQLTLF